MRVIAFVIVVLGVVGMFVADGASMYGAHRTAEDFSERAAERAVQTYANNGGSLDGVQDVIEEMAIDEGVHLVDISYHKGTTKWYEVTVSAEGTSFLLKHLPVVKNHLAQQSTSVAHF